MTNLSEEIRGIIQKTLPNLSEETQAQIITKLQNSGLESKEDLKYVQKEDIADLLPVIQLRKLLDTFKQESEAVTLDLQVIPPSSPQSSAWELSESSQSSGTSTRCTSPLLATDILSSQAGNDDQSNRPSTSQILKTWPETFQVQWEKMPQEIRSAVVDGKRPKPMERRQMVRVVVDEMRRYDPNPTRSQCLTVVRNIIRQYPKSFADMAPNGTLLGGGYSSLLIQVKNRIENLNRPASCMRHRSSGSLSTNKRRPSDNYGCTRFQPDLPSEETDETVEQKRITLVDIYSQEGAAGAERADVKNLMELTFCLQRHQINALPPPDVEDMRSKWPFLFIPKFIYAHFELLTDISVLRTLELSMEECGRTITQYFTRKPTNNDVKNVLSKGEDDEMALCVVQLLMAHFGENLTGLFLFTDMCATAADVETTLDVPASPRLILPGGTGPASTGRWMITLEGHVISESSTPTFLTGLAALFAVYYVFNLQYQDEAACTLEFIQRRFIGVNPERGSKATRGKGLSKKTGSTVQKKHCTVNGNVSTLLKNLIDFQ